MNLEEILKVLTALGLSPLEIFTVIALIIVYNKNNELWTTVLHMKDSLDECLGKIKPGEPHSLK